MPCDLDPPSGGTTAAHIDELRVQAAPPVVCSAHLTLHTGLTMRSVTVGEITSALAALGAPGVSVTSGSCAPGAPPITPFEALEVFVLPARSGVRPRANSATNPIGETLSSGPTPDARLIEAERQWRASFRRRVSVMKGALGRAGNEDLPTPPTDGDD